ncbi:MULTISPECIES: hypothetical protein [unclassified Streptomyces]|uniref:hypothetical protein n=1 Tax=unclassified Streptomyces TaxID=2593676 RepID=UPI0006AE51CF|nr:MULTISPECIES: hypothetical protein [unclassified Streptomyces]KOU80858.1 hypothetical protein ADK93_32340 [Streptomyces sp. XY58]KOV01677.1 hypothetical protein ADK89_30960 [Streptomyces sp. XY37]KOV41699.1 hypothetical protein ADK99_31670 [Streptomyces sp. MMG1064]
MSGRRRLDWLGLTPEPERELPTAVAALRASSRTEPTVRPARPRDRTPEELAAAERRRVERLILRGSRHSWLRYLAEVTDLVTGVAAGSRSGDPAAALLAGEVVLDHHRMLIGLPGPGYGRTAAARTALESAVRALRTRSNTPTHTPVPTHTRTGGSR